MKILRNILIGFFVLLFLGSIGLYIYIQKLDVNKFKPQIVEGLKKAIGREATIGNISLNISIQHGIAVEIKNFKIGEDAQFSQNDFLNIQTVYLHVDVLAYLKSKTVSVTKLSIEKPQIVLIRNEAEVFNFQSILDYAATSQNTSTPASGGSSGSSSASPTAALPLLIVKSIELTNGEVLYQDKMPATAMTIPVKDIDIHIKDFSLDKSFIVESGLSVLSQTQNVLGSGEVELDMSAQTVSVNRFSVKSDLAQLSSDKLKQAIAALAPVNFDGGFKGQVYAVVEELKAGAAGIIKLNANVKLADGELKLKEIFSPFKELTADVDINEHDVVINNFSTDFSDGKISFQGRLDDYLKTQKPTFKLIAAGINPAGIVDPAMLPAKVEGVITAQLAGNAQGVAPELMKKTLDGKGEFAFLDGKLKDFNLLKIVLEKLSSVPVIGGTNLEQALESRLSAKYKEKLQMKDTIIDSFQANLQLMNGALQFNDLILQSSGMVVGLNGQVDFDQNVILNGQLLLDKELSSALVSTNEIFSYLLNENKEISMPLTTYQGKLTQLRIYPDLKDFASNAVVNKGKDELKKALFKVLDIETKPNNTTNSQNPADGKQPVTNQPEGSPEQKAIESLINQIPIFGGK